MKPLLLLIASLILSLPNFNLEKTGYNEYEGYEYSFEQQGIYFNQNLSFIGTEIITYDCTECHMEYTMDGKSLIKILNDNFDANLTVHKANDPEYINSLESFLATHNQSEAEAKYVDRQKVVDFGLVFSIEEN